VRRYRLIEAYLARLQEALGRDAPRTERVRDEIRDHLLTALEAELRRGAAPEVAEQRAIERLGSPEVIARQFRSAWPGGERPAGRKGVVRKGTRKLASARRLKVTGDSMTPHPVPRLCSFCGLGDNLVERIVAGPDEVAICSGCLEQATEIIAREKPSGSTRPDSAVARSTPTGYACSFCGRPHHAVERLVAGPRFVFICDRCVVRFTASVAPI